MPKVMPNDMPKASKAQDLAMEFYDLLMMSASPQKDVKPFMAKMQQTCSTREIQQVLKTTYAQLADNGFETIATYLKELYGNGVNKKCFEREVSDEVLRPKPKIPEVIKKESEQQFAHGGVITLDNVENYCLTQCFDYDEVHAIYNMLLELFFTDMTPRWIMAKVNIQKRMQDLKKGIMKVEIGEGGELVMEKNVEYEVKNVEAGGTGVNINKGGKR